MECEEPVTRRATGQIVMDYLTDTVVSHKVTLLGQPYLTPDSRIVVTVHRERTSVTLTVQHTTGTNHITDRIDFYHTPFGITSRILGEREREEIYNNSDKEILF